LIKLKKDIKEKGAKLNLPTPIYKIRIRCEDGEEE